MNSLVGGLSGSKMSSSDPDSKVDLLDSAAVVTAKLKKAFCEEGNIIDNPILQFLKAVVFPVSSLTKPDYEFVIQRTEKWGGNISFGDYQSLEAAFEKKDIHPGDLKKGATLALNELLEPIRQIWANDPSLQELTLQAYPPPKPKLISHISKVDLRVGRVMEVNYHPERDTLYVEKIDLGEASGPRTIVSGLSKYMTREELTGKLVVIAANMKPAKFAGIVSQGMILAASNEDKSVIEVLEAPDDALVGESITFEGFESHPDLILNPKQKVMEKCAVDFSTSEDLVATFQNVSFLTSAGPVTVRSLKKASIS